MIILCMNVSVSCVFIMHACIYILFVFLVHTNTMLSAQCAYTISILCLLYAPTK